MAEEKWGGWSVFRSSRVFFAVTAMRFFRVLFWEGAVGEAQGLSTRSVGVSGFPVMQTWNPSGLSVKLRREAFFACCTLGGRNLLLVAVLCRLRGNPQAVLRHWVLNCSLGLLSSLETCSFP